MTVMNGYDPVNAPRESTKTHLHTSVQHIIHTPSPPVTNDGGSYPIQAARSFALRGQHTRYPPVSSCTARTTLGRCLARLLRTCDHDTRVTAPRPLRPLLFRTVGATTPLNPTTGRAAAAHRTGGLES